MITIDEARRAVEKGSQIYTVYEGSKGILFRKFSPESIQITKDKTYILDEDGTYHPPRGCYLEKDPAINAMLTLINEI